jgi:hypothetical protein
VGIRAPRPISVLRYCNLRQYDGAQYSRAPETPVPVPARAGAISDFTKGCYFRLFIQIYPSNILNLVRFFTRNLDGGVDAVIMMLRNPRRHGYIAAFGLLAIIYFWVYLGRPYSLPPHIPLNPYSGTPESPQVPAIDVFDVEPFRPEAIQSVCSQTKWTPGLVFTCDNSGGGIGNLRNSILNCVRYAIEAGGALVIPRMRVRNSTDIRLIWNEERAELDYMFDKQHFIASLRQSCPELVLYDTIYKIKNYESRQTEEPISLQPEHLFEGVFRLGPEHLEEWRMKFDDWLRVHGHVADINSLQDAPAVVGLERSYLQFPVYYNGASFAVHFGRILRIRSDAHTLAIRTLESLAKTYSLPIGVSNINVKNPIPLKGFFGAHLRTEIDAVEGWPTGDPMWHFGRYDVQSQLYLDQILNTTLSVIYIASGNATEVSKFAADARARKGGLDLVVTTKSKLLSGSDLALLNSMAWDQQALVDFLVLMVASQFAGVAHSSFAWNIALKRHRWSKMAGSDHLKGPQMLSDEYSQIYGEIGGYPEYAANMWP